MLLSTINLRRMTRKEDSDGLLQMEVTGLN